MGTGLRVTSLLFYQSLIEPLWAQEESNVNRIYMAQGSPGEKGKYDCDWDSEVDTGHGSHPPSPREV